MREIRMGDIRRKTQRDVNWVEYFNHDVCRLRGRRKSKGRV